MDEKTLHTLEFLKVLERLAGYAAFSVSAELALKLRPTSQLEEAQRRQALTSEARRLLSVSVDFSIGGARDIRPSVERAQRAGVLEGTELVDVKNTQIVARQLARTFERQEELYPHLSTIAERLLPPPGLVDAISRALSERGEVLDSASEKLGNIRRELKTSHDRLMGRLERLITDPKTIPLLQEPIITQRGGRYVIPLRAEFKSKIRSIVHDQSASGATLFVEPLATVELNNRWHELQLAERDEERRILAELSTQVGRHAEDLLELLAALAELDLALMCAKYAEDLRAAEPLLEPIREGQSTHPGSTIRLRQARHPLLDPQTVVPIDVVLDERTYALVITGPNTGGKTVTLKTVGLLALMAQAGLHIPAQSGSAMSVFRSIFADIGDEQSIEQSLSTFSGHINNIIRILKRANATSLVLLDELGAGTDPQEGAALARALLAYLLERRVTCLVATHYPELKAYAHTTPGMINASMEFDLRSLRPTYHLTIGLPGRSNALLIAERLGLPAEVLEDARSTLDPADLRAEDLLDEIHRQRDLTRQAQAAAERQRQEAEKLRAELSQRLERIEEERLVILEQAREHSQEELDELQQEVAELRRALQRAHQPLEALKPLQEQLETLQKAAQQPVTPPSTEQQAAEAPLRVGQKVRLRSLRMEGVITALGEDDVEVQLGALRLRARRDELQPAKGLVTEPPPLPKKKPGTPKTEAPLRISLSHPSPGVELDLRGQNSEDALALLEPYLESAYLAGLPYVRIIHGKGTGRLRTAVRAALRQSPHIQRFETGLDSEGGEGVTVAHLFQD